MHVEREDERVRVVVDTGCEFVLFDRQSIDLLVKFAHGRRREQLQFGHRLITSSCRHHQW